MNAILLLAIAQLTNGLEIQRDSENYAYVTMWIDKTKTPAKFFQHVLTKAETGYLNSGEVSSDTGKINLDKSQKIKNAAFLEEEGKPKKEELKEKIQLPLRPRNSNYNGILDMAKNLRDVGAKYPLVVLTNYEDFKNESIKTENPNLKFIFLNESDWLDRNCKIGAGHETHFQKLMIWKLTQYDKLIWLDTDLAFSKNVDYVFKQDVRLGARIYGQIDDYHCDGREWSPTSGGICSAMLLLKPSTLHFQGLMMQQKRMQSCWGDQSIIMSYFNGKGRQAMQFQRSTINFARCKDMGQTDVWHFSGSPGAKRIGDPEGFKRTETGQLVNVTEIKLKAKAKAEKKKAEMEAAKAAKKAKKEKKEQAKKE